MLIGYAWACFIALSLTGVSAEDNGSEISKFQKLFMQKRIEQLAAVKNILKLDDLKRKTLLDQITSKLFQVTPSLSLGNYFHIYSGSVLRPY